MTIDKEQLISLLVDKTGLERDQVENQLQELVNRIQQAAEEGKTFEVEVFGTFSMQEGELHFEPTDTLETEINNKYAGMKPIELIGAFKEPDGEEIPDMDKQQQGNEDRVWAFDQDAIEPDETVEEPVAETADEEEQDDEPEQVAAEEDQPEEDIEIDADAAQPEKPPEEQQETTSGHENKQLEKVTASAEDETDPIGRFLVAALVVIALGLAGFLIYDSGLLSGSKHSSQPKTSQQMTDVPSQTTGDTQEESPSKEASDSNKQNENTDSEPEQELEVTRQGGSDAQQPIYGLRGTLNDKANDGYTIVVHSLRVKDKAEKRKQGLQEAGYRALINKASVDGTTYYRVGIGQFETVTAAQQAVSRIPEEYRDNNFIKRIK